MDTSNEKVIKDMAEKIVENSELTNRITPPFVFSEEFKLNFTHDHKSGKGIYAVSKPVKWFSKEIKEAMRMVRWLNHNNGRFPAPLITAYAISHCQVCDDPSNMFVVAKELVNSLRLQETKKQNKRNFWFPSQAIFNAVILEKPEKIEADVPKRVVTKEDGKVGSKIVIEKKMVSNLMQVPDACMSFPNRTSKTTKRFYRIKVKYQTRGIFGSLRTHTEWVTGLKSHIFQHETDHANGKNIYYEN